MRAEPKRLMQAPALEVQTDPEKISLAVRQHYQDLGCLLDEDDAAALLADAACQDCPIVGVTRGFLRLTGHSREHLLGKNCRIMLNGVPEVAISKSARKNLRDFCRMCRLVGMSQMSEATSLQPNSRQDGSQFMNFFMVGLCLLERHPFIIGVARVAGEGLLVRLPSKQIQEITEESRATLLRIRGRLHEARPQLPLRQRSKGREPWPGFAFYSERLQDHCTLFNCNLSVVRREPHELATNCLVYGDAPVPWRDKGLFFAVSVVDVVSNFNGLPLLGFTKRKPQDAPDLYPPVAKCMGSSVLVGACGEAFARDGHEHFCIGFKPPPPSEVAAWTLQKDVPNHRREPPLAVQPGDELGCLYTRAGRLQLWRNGKKFMDFDLERPPEVGTDYYAVVDVCFAVYHLTLIPRPLPVEAEGPSDADAAAGAEPPRGPTLPESLRQGSPSRKDKRRQTEPEMKVARTLTPTGWEPGTTASKRLAFTQCIDHDTALEAIRAAVDACRFCVTVADPRGETPLIAVSEAFEELTGYQRSEILGKNCRFLNEGCYVSHQDIVGLRVSASTGAPFVAMLLNRKKSGESFVNMLDLQGLAVARDTDTGEVIWFCVGIQADVTGVADESVPNRHGSQRQEVARQIWRHLRQETAQSKQSAKPGALRSCCLLEEPVWMNSRGSADNPEFGRTLSCAGLRPTMPPGSKMPPLPLTTTRALLACLTSGTSKGCSENEVSVRSFTKAYSAKAASDEQSHRDLRLGHLSNCHSRLRLKGWLALTLVPALGTLFFYLGSSYRRKWLH